MDSLAKQEARTEKGEYSSPWIEPKLLLRKKEIEKIIWVKEPQTKVSSDIIFHWGGGKDTEGK